MFVIAAGAQSVVHVLLTLLVVMCVSFNMDIWRNLHISRSVFFNFLSPICRVCCPKQGRRPQQAGESHFSRMWILKERRVSTEGETRHLWSTLTPSPRTQWSSSHQLNNETIESDLTGMSKLLDFSVGCCICAFV